jgi:hypothetical protein
MWVSREGRKELAAVCLVFLLGLTGFLALAAAVALGVMAWHNYSGLPKYAQKLSRIGKLRPGYRRVRGKVVPIGECLRSPVTNRECVYYRYNVYEDKTTYSSNPELPGGTVAAFALGGAVGAVLYSVYDTAYAGQTRTSHSWRELLEDEDSSPMVVEDETGCVEVKLRGATMDVKEAARLACDTNHPPPQKLADWVTEEFGLHIVDDRGWMRNLHFVEQVLLAGAKITVVGNVETQKNGDLCFQSRGKELLVTERVLSKSGQQARSRALGYLLGAVGALVLAAPMLLLALFLLFFGKFR